MMMLKGRISIAFFIFLAMNKGINSLAVITPEEINVLLGTNIPIVLNCSYVGDFNGRIDDIIWNKESHGKYAEMVKFDSSGALYFDDYLKNRSTYVNYSHDSPSAILTINNVSCEDRGSYMCSITYIENSSGKKFQSYTNVSVEVDAEPPVHFSMQPNISLEEHDEVNLSCLANVGNQNGVLTLSKHDITSDQSVTLKTSSSVDKKRENCTTKAFLSVPYNISRDDNGAIFRCSSLNGHTPSTPFIKEIGPINVYYGPWNISIASEPPGNTVVEGKEIRLICSSDGNPKPNFTWRFNSTDVVNSTKYTLYDTLSGTELSFDIDKNDGNENYTCIASSDFNNKLKFMSFSIMLNVQENDYGDLSKSANACSEDPCTFIEICSQREESGNAKCSLDVWKLISFVFIALTLIFGGITAGLILSARCSKSNANLRDGHVSYTREKFDDFGGYTDPKDVKRPEKGEIKLDKDGRDNPYADPVDFQTQYAVVQKTWETPVRSSKDANLSNPSNLLNNTDLSNTENPSSPSETANPKNSSSDEKTPGSTETSETIPKPPNVYDDAWV